MKASPAATRPRTPSIGSAALLPEPPIVPDPSGEPLTLKVRCWTSTASKAPCTRHAITIHPDWSITTPHDLATERVAVAFGGYLSCLELPATMRAARRWLELQLRAGAVPATITGRPPRWRVKPAIRCCSSTGYDTATQAADHVRDPRHLAQAHEAPRRQLTDVLKAIGNAYKDTGALTLDGPEAEMAAAVCSRGATDVTELWYAGMHPRRILEIHDGLGVPGRLPGRFYLGVLIRGVDVGWLADTIDASGLDSAQLETTHEPMAEVGGVRLDGAQEPVAEWLAWTRSATDVIDPTRRGRWLALGVSRRMILLLDQYLFDPDDVAELADGIGRDPDGAARQLAGWLEAGLRPPIADLVRLHESGIGPHWYVPSSLAVARLRRELGESELGDTAHRTSDTELAFQLAVAGTVPDVLASWRTGTTLW